MPSRLHGLGYALEVWRPQIDHLRASRRVIAYDQRGHGASGKPRGGVYTLEALAPDLEAVRRGLERFVLVGHSLSGAVMTTYLGAHPEAVHWPCRPPCRPAPSGEVSPSP